MDLDNLTPTTPVEETLVESATSWSLESVSSHVLGNFSEILQDDTKTLKVVEEILAGESFLLKNSKVQQSIGTILFAHAWIQKNWELWIWEIHEQLCILRKKKQEA